MPTRSPLDVDPDEYRLAGLLRAVVTEAIRLEHLTRPAESLQWARPLSKEDDPTGRRIKGPVSDPTGTTATALDRLQLRADVIASERVLTDAATALSEAAARMARYHDADAALIEAAQHSAPPMPESEPD